MLEQHFNNSDLTLSTLTILLYNKHHIKDIKMGKRSTLSKGISTVGSFTRGNLERMGAMIDSANAKTGKPRQFKAVNLGDEDYQQDLFREQTLKATQQLLGTRFAAYGK